MLSAQTMLQESIGLFVTSIESRNSPRFRGVLSDGESRCVRK